MKICYTCDCCAEPIGEIIVDKIDEEQFGFSCLTPEERQDIIKIDRENDTVWVTSLCDSCIEALGLDGESMSWFAKREVH